MFQLSGFYYKPPEAPSITLNCETGPTQDLSWGPLLRFRGHYTRRAQGEFCADAGHQPGRVVQQALQYFVIRV